MRYLSVFNSDSEILQAISDIHLKGEWYDLDCTYSKGVFWQNIPQPKYKSDLEPLFEDVMKIDSRTLEGIDSNTLQSIVFDPPFLFRKRKAVNNDKMCARFSYFTSYEELIEMYQASLRSFKRALKKSGYLCFKCQDMTDNKFYCTHNDIINYATQIGFTLKDIIIKTSKQKLQRDAKQQNCVAKVHSYWLIFKKEDKKPDKINPIKFEKQLAETQLKELLSALYQRTEKLFTLERKDIVELAKDYGIKEEELK